MKKNRTIQLRSRLIERIEKRYLNCEKIYNNILEYAKTPMDGQYRPRSSGFGFEVTLTKQATDRQGKTNNYGCRGFGLSSPVQPVNKFTTYLDFQARLSFKVKPITPNGSSTSIVVDIHSGNVKHSKVNKCNFFFFSFFF